MVEKVRMVTEVGNYDIDLRADFNLGAFVTSIRSSGYFLHVDTNGRGIYTPAERIVTIFTFSTDMPMPLQTNEPGERSTLQ